MDLFDPSLIKLTSLFALVCSQLFPLLGWTVGAGPGITDLAGLLGTFICQCKMCHLKTSMVNNLLACIS